MSARTLSATWRRLTGRRASRWIGLLGSLGLLAVLAAVIYRGRDVIVAHLLTANPSMLLGLAGWYLLALIAFMAPWVLIMEQLTGRGRLWQHVRIWCVANAAKRLPGLLWQVGGRALLYSQIDIGARPVLVASALETVLSWIASALMALPFLAVILPALRWLWLALAAALFLAVLNPIVLTRILARTVEGWTAVRIPLRRVYGWILIFMVGWLLGGLMLFQTLRIFEPLPTSLLPDVIGAWTIAMTVSMFTVFLPSNLGVTELSLTVLLSRLAAPSVAALAAVGMRLALTVLDIGVGGVFAALGSRHHPE